MVEEQRLNAELAGRELALGLDRVHTVYARLDVAFTCPAVIVGGTIGKGSTCAIAERILLEAGYRVGTYTSLASSPFTRTRSL